MKTKKDFSIVIAYYNNNTILECLMWLLEDLKKSSRYNYEILIVDDSSKYPLSKPVLKFMKKNKINYFKREKNAGISEVRNTAIELTKGDIIVFLDADCYIKKGYFNELYRTFNKFKRCGMVYGKREAYHDLPFERFRELKYQYKSGKYSEKKIKEFNIKDKDFYLVSGQNMAIKRKVIRERGYFIPNSGCEDIEMQYLIMGAGYTSVYNPKLIIYHEHPHKFWHYIKKAFRYGRGFQRFKDRQGIRLLRNRYYRIYMGYGRIFEKFGSLKGKGLKYKIEVWIMEIGDFLANKLGRFIEKVFNKKNKVSVGAYGLIYKIKNNKLSFLVAKYSDGYGLIGGRLEKGESIEGGFIRELKEEVGLEKKDIVKLFRTNKKHSFASNRAKGMELHQFLIIKLQNNAEPIEKEVKFKWLSENEMKRLTKWVKTQEIINEIIGGIKENENL